MKELPPLKAGLTSPSSDWAPLLHLKAWPKRTRKTRTWQKLLIGFEAGVTWIQHSISFGCQACGNILSFMVVPIIATPKAESASRVVRLANVANNKFRKHGLLASHYSWIHGWTINEHRMPVFHWGVNGPELSELAKCGRKRVDPNACRNLHNLIKRKGRLLPVTISYIPMSKRLSRRRLATVPTVHPVIKLSEWAKTIFGKGGHFFMRGRSLRSVRVFRKELREFWERYAQADPGHPFFSQVLERDQWSQYIPIAIHGDEGRGKHHQPIMILSYQPLLPLRGQNSTMKRFLIYWFDLYFFWYH